jgi:DNA-binding beta-propeller fold protein YncE
MSGAEHIGRAVAVAVVACVAAAVCLAVPPGALAVEPLYTLGGHTSASIGTAGGEFKSSSPNGVAVDPANGDVYAVDGSNRRVQEFGPEVTPSFLAAWGWGVNSGGKEEFEQCTEALKCDEGVEGGGPGEFGEATGVAVDPVNQDVYVTDTTNGRVEYFEAGGAKYLHQFDGTSIDEVAAAHPAPAAFADPLGVAVDGAGRVYVEDSGHDVMDRFSSTGEFECQITATQPSGEPAEKDECNGVAGSEPASGAPGLALSSAQDAGLAVDSAGDVYIANTGDDVVDEFSASGAFVRTFGEGMVRTPGAVSVDAAGQVFVLSGEHSVYEFEATGTKIAEFTIEQSNGNKTAEVDALAVTASGGRVYAASRVIAFNELLVYGRFAAARTEVAETPVLGNATLHGTVIPGGLPVESCEFEWEAGEIGSYNSPQHVPCAQTPAQIGAGDTPVAVSAQLTGLSAYGHYHYRLVVQNAAGPAYGADTTLFASLDAFGFQLGGADALEMDVSDPNAEEPGVEEQWKLEVGAEQKMTVANPTAPDSQAGSHPFAMTTRLVVNSEADGNLAPTLRPKDYYVNIPAGFAGSVSKIPRCKMSELTRFLGLYASDGCATASQVGVVALFEANADTGRVEKEELHAVYNMVPPPGAPAEIAFTAAKINGGTAEPVTLVVRSDGDYGVTAEVRNVSEEIPIDGSELTLWGVPANAAHNSERFLPSSQERGGPGNQNHEPLPAGTPEVPFLTNPTRCGPVKDATIMADSWLHPGKLAEDGRPVAGSENWVTAEAQMYPDGITGCSKLFFEPQIEVMPATTVADSPMGMTVDLRVPQNENPYNLATSALKNATVTLPQGVSISPSAGNGLAGCEPGQVHLGSETPPECPNASQVGKVELTTPLLPEPLTGQIYLSSQHAGNTFHMFIVIEGQGVLVKLEGTVEANTSTGQIVSSFDENPQVPFSEIKLTFYSGANAALATPQQCGTFTTTSMLEPWSHDEADGSPTGTPNVSPFSAFTIGSGCSNTFAPSFTAGVSSPVAGAYSPFELSLSRQDGEQDLSGLQVKMPLGLVGKLAGVAECSQAQLTAAEQSSGKAQQTTPNCPAASEVGSVEAGAGPGEHPFFLPGKAYLTGPYEGAPYGIAVIVPALAGPFDLGTVVVRSRIEIDPHTAQVTVTSDPFPQMLDGIPLRMRRIDVHIDRPEFTYNPTTCEPTQISGTITATSGTQHPVSSRFQAGDCGSLPFKPTFTVYTHAGHTRRNGAYLRVKVTSGLHQANIKSVYVELPKILPSRDETLKLACSAKQFAENPAGCPAGSHVGTAVARTPILSTPLTGPAIFVSHGGAGFPDLDVVLQGAGVTVELEGNTNIDKGITSSNFKAVPDVPVNTFELTLPPSAHSALAAEGNLCYTTIRRGKQHVRRPLKLTMPTTITSHDGAQIKQNTIIHVEGCSKKKVAKKKKNSGR